MNSKYSAGGPGHLAIRLNEEGGWLMTYGCANDNSISFGMCYSSFLIITQGLLRHILPPYSASTPCNCSYFHFPAPHGQHSLTILLH